MSDRGGYILTWKDTNKVGLSDGTMLRPDVLGGLSREALGAFELPVGRERVALSKLFEIEGEHGDNEGCLTLRNLPRLPRVGARMASGELVIEGDAGDGLGASMRGGVIRVTGRVGDEVGGPDFGSDRGMVGGEIFVAGDAGERVGYRQRGGLIAVGGCAGKLAGYRMLAGTIVLKRGPYECVGLESRRGTMVLLDADSPVAMNATMTIEGEFAASEMVAVGLLMRHLGATSEQFVGVVRPDTKIRLLSLDQFEIRKAELWQVC